jgi:UDP:flavonoid glycosyltransferase YjiC (YdhE family)
VIAFIPDLDEARRARLASRNRIVVDRPVRLDRVVRHCELMICHGGEIGTGALLYGVPQLAFPLTYEQFLTARRMEQVGAGAWLAPDAPARDVGAAVEHVLREPRYPAAAKAFARRYAGFSPEEQRRRIIQRMEAILTPSPTGPEGSA